MKIVWLKIDMFAKTKKGLLKWELTCETEISIYHKLEIHSVALPFFAIVIIIILLIITIVIIIIIVIVFIMICPWVLSLLHIVYCMYQKLQNF